MGMSQQQSIASQPTGGDKSACSSQLRRYAMPCLALAAVSTFAGFVVARHGTKWSASDALQAAPVSEPVDSVNIDSAAFARLEPQQQAERLLERAIQRDPDALEKIGLKVDVWRGHLQNTDRLFDLVHTALNSDDLRVRGAALEIDLAANNLSKSSETVTGLVRQLRDEPDQRPWGLSRLGALGNRGVEPKIVLAQLLTYAHDHNEQTRFWAVEGLAILGSDNVIDPLLDRFAHDPSPRVRQRAACNLAQDGMLSKEQRLATVPHLLNFFDDDALDSTTRSWVYGALRVITGQALGNDADAWRRWWATHDARHKPYARRKGTLLA